MNITKVISSQENTNADEFRLRSTLDYEVGFDFAQPTAKVNSLIEFT
ncbi:MAG: hypothetical protein RMY28_027195 [Nostoc sp. ChiSLP01]|nr:hypothetical protein [Nostoc sp. CmiSLP01]MDZ8285542.1 hypothetical protein [Nostoc sp. ChiSLP01]